MSHTVIKTLAHESGQLRVIIFQRHDGSFGFENQKFCEEPLEQCWISVGRFSESFCDSAERALQEACERVDWLTNLSAFD